MPNLFQPPPGTRDFYPEDMALRRYIEDTWRRVSLRHGFVEVDGPTFEYLDLYKVKSGDEIVSQLFHFESRGEDKTQFALRPEFTPTLARMVAAKANALPRPIKWFSIPRCYRAERPQKGRLREFIQWNVDMLGGETPETRTQFDIEVMALCLDCLREFGLGKGDVELRWNSRAYVEYSLKKIGIPPARYPAAMGLMDRLTKISAAQRQEFYASEHYSEIQRRYFEKIAAGHSPVGGDFWKDLTGELSEGLTEDSNAMVDQELLENKLALQGLSGYAKYDPSIVRGLAYYTGMVWEVADTRGHHRAIAGGGRYDKLIEMFGGPPLPAVGFGAGDVTLANLLEELGKLPQSLAAAPDVYVVNGLPDSDEAVRLLGALRQRKLAAVTNYKATKNIGKLLTDAASSGAKLAVILGPAEFEQKKVKVKDLTTRTEQTLPLEGLVEALAMMCGKGG